MQQLEAGLVAGTPPLRHNRHRPIQADQRYARHLAGDAVLVTVAASLAEIRDAGCFAARLAGDEFCVISPLNEPEMISHIR
jgi:GGDEF domain-containing protein